MTKDDHFNWPQSFLGDEGKTFRALLHFAEQNSKSKARDSGYQANLERIHDFEKRFGTVDVQGAAAIAFSLLGYLAKEGEVKLPENLYL